MKQSFSKLSLKTSQQSLLQVLQSQLRYQKFQNLKRLHQIEEAHLNIQKLQIQQIRVHEYSSFENDLINSQLIPSSLCQKESLALSANFTYLDYNSQIQKTESSLKIELHTYLQKNIMYFSFKEAKFLKKNSQFCKALLFLKNSPVYLNLINVLSLKSQLKIFECKINSFQLIINLLFLYAKTYLVGLTGFKIFRKPQSVQPNQHFKFSVEYYDKHILVYIFKSKISSIQMIRQHILPAEKFKSILVAAKDIIYYAKTYHRYKTHSTNLHQANSRIYQQAKIAQTQERNLQKAALLYADSACNGIKLDSCIKDFASTVHQMGQTFEAVRFLLEVRPYYHGDFKKFDRLLNTLQRQLKPSKKHECKSLLLELPSQRFAQKYILSQIFYNSTRVKSCKFFKSLDLLRQEKVGKWMVLQFQSFSAAKKTLQKFNQQNWFMINKFWLREQCIMCEAKDGWQDFDEGLVISDQILNQGLLEKYKGYKWNDVYNNRELMNYLALRLIEEDLHYRCQKSPEMKTHKDTVLKSIIL